MMSESILEAIVGKAFYCANGYVALAFQGGEPMPGGIGFYKKPAEYVLEYK